MHDAGWSDGNPRPLEEQTKAFLSGKKLPPGAAPVGPQGQWAPRPRSKNAPRPAALVSYGEGVGEVRRNNMDAVDLEGPTMEELILQNAESMKQFEYLEKSLVTFQNAASLQAADLRQPVVRERHVMADVAPLDDEDQQGEHHTAYRVAVALALVCNIVLHPAPSEVTAGAQRRTSSMSLSICHLRYMHA